MGGERGGVKGLFGKGGGRSVETNFFIGFFFFYFFKIDDEIERPLVVIRLPGVKFIIKLKSILNFH